MQNLLVNLRDAWREPAQESWLRAASGHRSGPRHRGQYSHLQRGERGAAAAASVSRIRSPDAPLAQASAKGISRDAVLLCLARELRRLGEAEPRVRKHGHLHRPDHESERDRRAGATLCRQSVTRLFLVRFASSRCWAASLRATRTKPAEATSVVLSYNLWKTHFGGDPKIVGSRVDLNDKSYLVAGVMPKNFVLPGWAQLWVPMAWTDQERAIRGNHNCMVIARLKPGVTEQQAQAEMDTISKRLEQQYPEDDQGWGAAVLPLQRDAVSDVRLALLVLLGAVAAVLLIACANVANLVMAKTLERRKEIAIRAALGASRIPTAEPDIDRDHPVGNHRRRPRDHRRLFRQPLYRGLPREPASEVCELRTRLAGTRVHSCHLGADRSSRRAASGGCASREPM